MLAFGRVNVQKTECLCGFKASENVSALIRFFNRRAGAECSRLRRVNEFGCHLVTSRYELKDVLRYGVLLDKLGFDHLKVGDHTLIPNAEATYPNAHVVLAALGAMTKRIRLSTSVTDPLRRHPVEIAQWVATMDQLTRGRAAVGIGAGEVMNLAPFGIEYQRPFTRLKEAIEVMKLLWIATPSRPSNYDGEIFRLRDAYLQVRPVQKPHPPVYIGAISPKTRALVGEIASGWVPMAMESPATLKEHMEDVQRGAKRAGRRLRDIEVAVTVYTDVSNDTEAAYRSVEGVARSMLVWEREIIKKQAGIEIPEELSVQRMSGNDKSIMKKIDAFGASIPRWLVEEATAFGTADRCIKKFEQYLDAGATSIIICNVGKNQDLVFRKYSEEIIPYLKRRYGRRK
jgi:alkanesulfonate monooxygenase SsuD/methylene tetrahydromethanopterin reductase-like flavin-dependent oxidoreductase (luciferase family)